MNLKKILLVILMASVSFWGGAYYKFTHIAAGPVVAGTKAAPDTEREHEAKPESEPEKLDIAGRINILMLGEDNVDGAKRSDTVAFVAVDVDANNVRVLSLPRDTRVHIPGHGNQKLNHAYAYGGVELLKATIEEFLGTTIHYYVKVDYDNFPQLVDLVGGVDMYVGKAMKYRDKSQGLVIDIPVGKQHMDGDTALKYVRFRKDALGDIGRIQRQQQFLKALLHKMYEPENMVRFTSLAQEVTNALYTDMRPSLTLQLCYFIKKLDNQPDRIFFTMLPGTPALIDNLSYWVAEPSGVANFLTANADELMAMVQESRLNNKKQPLDAYSDAEYSLDSADGTPQAVVARNTSPSPQDVMSIVTSIPEAVVVLNGTGRSGVGKSIATQLQRMGVDVYRVDNAKHFDYKSSNIIFPEGASAPTRETAQLLSKLCGISGSLTKANKMASSASLIVGHDYERLLKRLEDSYSTMQ